MTLTKIQLKPGIQKQTSDLGAAGGYVDSDNVRFRYGLPEKIGGWQKTTDNRLIGVARDAHHWVALDGTHLAALGTDKNFISMLIVFCMTSHLQDKLILL